MIFALFVLPETIERCLQVSLEVRREEALFTPHAAGLDAFPLVFEWFTHSNWNYNSDRASIGKLNY